MTARTVRSANVKVLFDMAIRGRPYEEIEARAYQMASPTTARSYIRQMQEMLKKAMEKDRK